MKAYMVWSDIAGEGYVSMDKQDIDYAMKGRIPRPYAGVSVLADAWKEAHDEDGAFSDHRLIEIEISEIS